MRERKPEREKIVADMIRRFPNLGSSTLGRKLYKENKSWFPSEDAAYCAVRHARGNHGVKSRKQAKDRQDLLKENGKLPECPPSIAESWTPYLLTGSKRLLILSDIHVPYHDEKALTAAVKYGKDFGPDTVLLNGDSMDFYSISRWDKNPAKRDLKGEIDRTAELLDWIQSVFPKAQLVFKEGNHEERWTKYIWAKAPELWDLPQCRLENILELERREIVHVADQRFILFGGKPDGTGSLPIVHGHELGRSLFAPVNMARGAFLRTIHTILCGHGHRTSQHTETDMFKNEVTCWSTGCLCDTSPEYARINKMNAGFAVAIADGDQWHVDNLRISKQGKVW